MPRVGAAVLKARYICSFPGLSALASTGFGTAGRVYLAPIDVSWPVIIDRIIYQVAGTKAGNVCLGIYREGPTADSPAGGALVVEGASTAQVATYSVELHPITDTILIPGQYYLAIQGSNTTGTAYRWSDIASLFAYYYDRAGGYGAFTNPCPAVTAVNTNPSLAVRVKENLPAGYRL